MANQGSTRIDELRGRIQKDPASIAFAQLAEEYRRAGRLREAMETCRVGLTRHPGYLSARVTLGRALLDANQLDEACRELTDVLEQAPENLAAIRGLAEVHRLRGELPEALEQFEDVIALGGGDSNTEQLVRDLRREIGGQATAATHHAALTDDAGGPSADRPDEGRARRVSAYLHRWLEAIMTDRRRRLYPASS